MLFIIIIYIRFGGWKMYTSPSLVGAVMLETMWSTRQKDLLDLISPFINYSIAHCTPLSQKINLSKVSQYLDNQFGYTDVPPEIIKRVLKRDVTHYQRKDHGTFFFIVPLDSECASLDRKRAECIQITNRLGDSLLAYLQTHCKKEHVHTREQAINLLQAFFSKYSVSVGKEEIDFTETQRKSYESDYYIARYIVDARESKDEEYTLILSLVKGYFLKAAIYMQPENGNLCTESYKDVTFYYDTPVLLRLLGYQSDDENFAAKQLHKQLQLQKANFGFFPQTEQEVYSILSAYQHAIENVTIATTSRTLEGLDKQGYTVADVDRAKKTYVHKLKSLSIYCKTIPDYPKTADGSVDESKVLIDEAKLKKLIMQARPSYPERSLNVDISSITATHLLRNGVVSDSIEKVSAIFVTTNKDLARVVNKYYAHELKRRTSQLVITDSELAAITWVKSASFDNKIPESELLANAYAAMQPIPEVMDTFCAILAKMQNEGAMTNEEVAALRSERFIQKELLFESENNPDAVTVDTVSLLRDKYVSKIKDESIAKMQQQNEREIDKIYSTQRARIERAAHYKAKQIKKRALCICNAVEYAIIISAFAVGFFDVAHNYSNMASSHFIRGLILILLGIGSVVGTLLSIKGPLEAFFEWVTNQLETSVFDREYAKNCKLLSLPTECSGIENEQADVCDHAR